MSTIDGVNTEQQYGNFMTPQMAGLGKLTLGPVAVLGAELLLIILTMSKFGIWSSVVGFPIMGLTAVLVYFRDAHDKSHADKIQERLMFENLKLTRRTSYRSGVTGVIPGGTTRLPGMLSTTEVSDHLDSYEEPYGLVRFPRTGHDVAVFELSPDAGGLHDSGDFDQFVANWGGFGASFCREAGIHQFSVCIETSPDFGHRARRHAEAFVDPSAPELARESVLQSGNRRVVNAANTRAYLAVTFQSTARNSDKRQDRHDTAAEIGRRIPSILSRLEGTGAGAAVAMTSQQIAETIKSSYDPALAHMLEEAKATGGAADLAWSNVGPSASDAYWAELHHDSGISRTWEMSRAIRGTIGAKGIARLLQPHSAIDRKRVTLIYQPIDDGRAQDIVEFDVRQAEIAHASGRGTATSGTNLRKATRTSDEIADGAGLLEFAMLVTATIIDNGDETRAPKAWAALENNLAAPTRVSLRPAFGKQDVAFAASLPLGLDPEANSYLAASINKSKARK